MPKKGSKLPFPPHFINHYIWNELKQYDDLGISNTADFMPFIFATPTNTEEIQNYLGNGSLLVNCERMLRYRTSPFYPIKKEQLAWYVRTSTTEQMMNFMNVITTVLDREDVAAQAVNSWAASNPIPVPGTSPVEYIPHNVFFHRIKVFIIDESRDVLELAAVNGYVSNKILIEYDYHTILDDSNGEGQSDLV